MKVRGSNTFAYVAPFAAFMILLEIVSRVRIENSALPWWRQFPEQWGYPLQCIVCLVLLVWCAGHYPPLRTRGFFPGFCAATVGIAIWLAPPLLHVLSGIGEQASWLEKLGFQPRLEGFDPHVFENETGASSGVTALVVSIRLLRLVLIVPLIEEIFWRGFLMRFITKHSEGEWFELPLRKCDTRSVFFTAAAFALAHAGPDMAVAFIYGLIAGWLTIRTGNLWAVVFMHVIANLILGLFILKTGWWGLW